MPLTELAIKNLKPRAKLYRVADSNGLCLEITPTGSKLWRYRFYHLGKAQMTALGFLLNNERLFEPSKVRQFL